MSLQEQLTLIDRIHYQQLPSFSAADQGIQQLLVFCVGEANMLRPEQSDSPDPQEDGGDHDQGS